jgi:hypothetical protein
VFWFCIRARLWSGRKEWKETWASAPARAYPAQKTLSDENAGPKKDPGAKARIFVGPCAARLKSCPDTKHQSGDTLETRAFRMVGSIHPLSPGKTNWEKSDQKIATEPPAMSSPAMWDNHLKGSPLSRRPFAASPQTSHAQRTRIRLHSGSRQSPRPSGVSLTTPGSTGNWPL